MLPRLENDFRILTRLKLVPQRPGRDFGLGISKEADRREEVRGFYSDPRARHGHRTADLQESSNPVVRHVDFSLKTSARPLGFNFKTLASNSQPRFPARTQLIECAP
ncbi:hypothetical protein SDC9_181161 [bioreactor metagenome]|uniref:Uncharacterized protein n=1 Tax=bioreactor metagenome TaxID=1076179 RepID=A0A645H4R1_9ZZZZ